MKYVRIEHEGAPHFAMDREDGLHLLDAAPWAGGTPTGVVSTTERRLAPVTPSKVICVGRNYRAHAEELGSEVPAAPLLFLKAPSSLLAPGGTILLPPESERVDHEAELAIVIGTRATDVNDANALEHIFGYTAANDVTARDLQRSDVQFTRAKSFDSFCPCGPFIETELDWADVSVQAHVDGELCQDGHTRQMIFGVPTLIAYISRVMTLLPGDLVLTGTPSGVGPMRPGSEVRVSLSGLGELRNFCAPRERG